MDETKLDNLFEADTGWFLYRVDTLFRNIQAKKSKHTDTKTRLKSSKRVERSRAAENVIDRGRPRCDAGFGRAWS